MVSLKLGRIEVIQVAESLTPTSPRFLFPGITPEDFAPYLHWLAPHFYTPADDRFPMPIQAFVVRTPHHTIVVDTCIGNDKKRGNPFWNMQHTPFLERLKELAGVTPEQVDVVLCTHLHVDHVGWNTRLVNGRWQPTFPKARYVFNRREYDYWSTVQEEEQAETFRDSVLPIMEAGKADFVEGAHEVTEGVVLEPTPGHTPGHCSVHLASRGAEAVITGDMMHHPIQLLRPQLCSRFAWDAPLARTTRRAFLERYEGRDIPIIGTHFAPPTWGRVVAHKDAFRLDV
jgi:glyoxylase-like metal-dependent hydrolase (beta-lactamase superfamily II)